MTKKNKPKRTHRNPSEANAPKQVGESPAHKVKEPVKPLADSTRWGIFAAVLVAFVWSYLPVFQSLISQWDRTPDYSHGYLVVPICLVLLWMNRHSMPETLASGLSWGGLVLILFAGALRMLGAYYYLEPVDGWSIPVWVSGAVWLVWGRSIFVWAAPALFFLFFMVPLPYSMETLLAQPLQSASTKISTVLLQSLLVPAVTEGNTIVVGDQVLEVARACSGLRIFVGIAALAYVFMMIFPRPFWAKLMVVLSILPIALIANSLRIVATGILYQFGMNDAAKHLSHDIAGFVMIPVAAGLFALLLAYLDRLFVEEETVDSASLVRQQIQGG